MKSNQELREYAKSKGVYLWEMAEVIGVSDANFSRRLRRELSDHEKTIMFKVVDHVAAIKAEEAAATTLQ